MANILKKASSKTQLQQMRKDVNGQWTKGDYQNISNPPEIFGGNHRSKRSRYGNKWR